MKNRDNSLSLISKYRNQIMGIATIWILFFHEWIIINPDSTSIFSKVFKHFLRFGYCGVDIFFLLSGMSLTYAIVKESTLKFYIKRFKRIILPALMMAIIQALEYNLSFVEMLRNLFGYNMILRNINSFLWFIPTIMIFYLFFPLYYKLLINSKSKLSFTLLILTIWLTIVTCFAGTIRTDLYSFIDRIPVFLIGIYIGYLQQNQDLELTRTSWLFILVMFISGIVLLFLTNYHDYYLIVPLSNSFLPSLFIAISLSFIIAKLLDLLSNAHIFKYINSFLLFFGSISFELYCMQERFGLFISDFCYRNFIVSTLGMNLILVISLPIIAFILMNIFKYFWKLIDHVFSYRR